MTALAERHDHLTEAARLPRWRRPLRHEVGKFLPSLQPPTHIPPSELMGTFTRVPETPQQFVITGRNASSGVN